MSVEEINKIKNIFEDKYLKLVTSYPTWDIKIPDYSNDSIDQIHDRYEKVVKRIIVYQTAQKWKVYFALAISGVEYLTFIKYKWQFMKNFTKIQLKTLHRYDQYLIELADKYHNTNGEEWPFYLKAGGTMGINIIIFGLINTFFGNGSVSESIHGLADQFMASGDENANHKTEISEVPEVPSGYTSPDFILNMLKTFAPGMSQFANNQTTTQKNNTQEIPVAEPIKQSEKTSDKPARKRSAVFN